jgi:5-oxoprolinase (ATP-hydrolysing)
LIGLSKPLANHKPHLRYSDRGGTFTDVHAYCPGGKQEEAIFKLLSVDPSNYRDAPTEGIRRVLEHFRQQPLPKEGAIDLYDVESIRMGTTVATNALLERKGERVAFLTTRGFRDILEIGNQARPHIFDLYIHKMDSLYDKVIEVDERVTMEEYLENPEPKPIDLDTDPALVEGLTGEPVRILKLPDMYQITQQLIELREDGFTSLAICFIHSYLYSVHEAQVAAEARRMGFSVSVSSELQPTVRKPPKSSPCNNPILIGYR